MKFISNKLRNSARGEACTLGIPGICNQDWETVVLAHIDSEGKGKGIKSPDFFAVFACSDCHAALDNFIIDPLERCEFTIRALYRTWIIWVDRGLIVVPETIKRTRPSPKVMERKSIYQSSPNAIAPQNREI